MPADPAVATVIIDSVIRFIWKILSTALFAAMLTALVRSVIFLIAYIAVCRTKNVSRAEYDRFDIKALELDMDRTEYALHISTPKMIYLCESAGNNKKKLLEVLSSLYCQGGEHAVQANILYSFYTERQPSDFQKDYRCK